MPRGLDQGIGPALGAKSSRLAPCCSFVPSGPAVRGGSPIKFIFPTMDQPLPSAGGYSRHHQHATPAASTNQQHHQLSQNQLFQSPQLPSPTQLLPPQSFPHQQPQVGWYHRTSCSRDELLPAPQQQQVTHLHQQPHVTVKRESVGSIAMQKDNASSSSLAGTRTSLDDAMPSTSDFVKKLYKYIVFIWSAVCSC